MKTTAICRFCPTPPLDSLHGISDKVAACISPCATMLAAEPAAPKLSFAGRSARGDDERPKLLTPGLRRGQDQALLRTTAPGIDAQEQKLKGFIQLQDSRLGLRSLRGGQQCQRGSPPRLHGRR